MQLQCYLPNQQPNRSRKPPGIRQCQTSPPTPAGHAYICDDRSNRPDNMSSFLRSKQAGIQKDLSASIRPELFTPDDQARYGINSQIRYLPILTAGSKGSCSLGARQLTFLLPSPTAASGMMPSSRCWPSAQAKADTDLARSMSLASGVFKRFSNHLGRRPSTLCSSAQTNSSAWTCAMS